MRKAFKFIGSACFGYWTIELGRYAAGYGRVPDRFECGLLAVLVLSTGIQFLAGRYDSKE